MKLGFIGLGNMGTPMVLNLLKAGYTVTVNSRNMNSDNVKKAISHGAQPAHTSREVAERSDIIMMCLPDPKISKELALGRDGIIEGVREGCVLIEFSTVPPSTVIEIASRLKGVDMLDAPVSGGRAAAERGELTIMVGGKEEVYERCLPILRVLGKRIFRVGPLGSGEAVKLINSMLAITHLLVSKEALELAVSLGIDVQLLHQIVEVSTGQSWMWSNWVPILISGGEVHSTIKTALKDLRCALTMAEETGVKPFIAASTLKSLQTYSVDETKDLSALFASLLPR